MIYYYYITHNPENTRCWPNAGLVLATVYDADPTLNQGYYNPL